MLKDDLLVNKKVEINIEDNPINYKSIIQGVDKDNFAIAIPTYKGEPLILRVGDQVNVKLYSQNEHYVFAATVLERKQDQIPLYVLTQPNDVERIQLRDFVRVKVALEAFYQVAKEEDKDRQLLLNPTTKAITMDMSGGGALLAIDESIPEAELLYVQIPIKLKGRTMVIQTFGRIKRYLPAQDSQTKNLVGIEFEGITERDRDIVIEFLFERMRVQRLLER